MTSVRVGAALNALPGPRYFEKHGLLELHPPISFPKASTLARWRAQVPEACEIALAVTRRAHAGKDGALRFERPGSRAWVDESVTELRPRFVILFTGPELSTGSRDRALLEAFVKDVQGRGPRVVWQPRGLWEPEQARTVALQVGCELALDLLGAEMLAGTAALAPAVAPTTTTGLAYGRIEALGTHARLGDGHLRRALDEALATGADEVRLVVEAEDALRKASRLATMVEGLAEEASGMAAPRRRAASDEDDDLDELDEDDDDLDEGDEGDEGDDDELDETDDELDEGDDEE
jgi:hypothetical protein